MAEGFARHLGKDVLEVQSAGTKPADKISSNAVEVMKEIGIDISSQYPKKIDFEYAKTADFVIIMGCGAENMCPAWFITKSENWDLEDPKGQNIEFYRKVRDEIKERILNLLSTIQTV